MTLVTVNAVVDISGHVVVLEIIGVVAAMATGALEDGVVVRVGVAGRADAAGIAMAGGKLRVLGVVERRIGPGRGVVAGLARRGEELRLRRVARVRGVVVIGLMAADAGGRQRGVVVIDVAVRAHARRHHVRTGQRESGGVVVKSGVGPHIGVMAKFARGGKARSGMSWVVGSRVILLMARVAKRAVQRVVVVDVAIRTLPRRHGMVTRELEAGGRVIEGAVGPLHGVVAVFASRREVGGDVIYRR